MASDRSAALAAIIDATSDRWMNLKRLPPETYSQFLADAVLESGLIPPAPPSTEALTKAVADTLEGWDELGVGPISAAYCATFVVEALVKAGWIGPAVPVGMTAEKLRTMATNLETVYRNSGIAIQPSVIAEQLRSWADAFEVAGIPPNPAETR